MNLPKSVFEALGKKVAELDPVAEPKPPDTVDDQDDKCQALWCKNRCVGFLCASCFAKLPLPIKDAVSRIELEGPGTRMRSIRYLARGYLARLIAEAAGNEAKALMDASDRKRKDAIAAGLPDPYHGITGVTL